MSWPRKHEIARIYRDKDKSYLIVFVEDASGDKQYGNMDAIANAYVGSDPSLCGTGVSYSYIYSNWLKRVAWNELPRIWRGAFRRYLSCDPRTIRGFWKKGEQPIKVKKAA